MRKEMALVCKIRVGTFNSIPLYNYFRHFTQDIVFDDPQSRSTYKTTLQENVQTSLSEHSKRTARTEVGHKTRKPDLLELK